MKTFTRSGSNILNALAFANVGNMSEFQQLLDQSTVIPATVTKHPGQHRAGSMSGQHRVDFPDTADTAATMLCATHK